MRGRPIPAATIRQILRLHDVLGIRGTAREAQVDRNTVRKYVRPPKPLDEAVSPIPPAQSQSDESRQC
jgi:hypothetical protein